MFAQVGGEVLADRGAQSWLDRLGGAGEEGVGHRPCGGGQLVKARDHRAPPRIVDMDFEIEVNAAAIEASRSRPLSVSA